MDLCIFFPYDDDKRDGIEIHRFRLDDLIEGYDENVLEEIYQRIVRFEVENHIYCLKINEQPFKICIYAKNEESEENEEETNEKEKINKGKIFKSDECVICLTNPPNILFCKCGHICICKKCNTKYQSTACPIFKTKNTIKRTI